MEKWSRTLDKIRQLAKYSSGAVLGKSDLNTKAPGDSCTLPILHFSVYRQFPLLAYQSLGLTIFTAPFATGPMFN